MKTVQNRSIKMNGVTKLWRFRLLMLCLAFGPLQVEGQTEIAIGTWRMHLSYNKINAVAVGNGQIFGASDNSIMVLEKPDNSISSYSKLNGLTGAGITAINVSLQTNQLLVAYEDGNLDIIAGNGVTNFDRLKNSAIITGSKKINTINFSAGFAYLSTDYGVVVFDLARMEVKETWRDLDVGGGTLKIYQNAFLGDSVFLATQNGIIAGNLQDNLLDYRNWKRYNTGPMNTPIHFVTAFQNKIYAAVDNAGLYHRENGNWVKESFLQMKVFTYLSASANGLLVIENSNLWRVDAANMLTPVTDVAIKKPVTATEDASGKLWIGDAKNGLVSNVNGSFSNYLPNGPLNSSSMRLRYNNHTMYSLPGGYTPSFLASGNATGFDSFNNGSWTNNNSTVHDITDIAFFLTIRSTMFRPLAMESKNAMHREVFRY